MKEKKTDLPHPLCSSETTSCLYNMQNLIHYVSKSVSLMIHTSQFKTFQDDMAFKQKQREEQKALQAAKEKASKKGPLCEWLTFCR